MFLVRIAASLLVVFLQTALPGIPRLAAGDAPLAVLFEHDVLADNVLETLARTRSLPEGDRFHQLRDWVFPVAAPSTLRVSGALTRAQSEPGRNLQSPVFDLLDVAEKMDRLPELVAMLDQRQPIMTADNEPQVRAYWAMKSLVHLAMNDAEEANTALPQLQELARKAPLITARDQWPELLVACRGLIKHASNESVRELISLLNERQDQRPSTGDDGAIRSLVCSLMGRVRWQSELTNQPGERSLSDLQDWIPVTGTSAWGRGPGYAPLIWQRNARHEIHHTSGHYDDLLLYHLPLTGDFEITGDIAGHGQTQLFLDGRILGVIEGDQLAAGTFRSGGIAKTIEPPLTWTSQWARFRARFQKDQVAVWLNGRPVCELSTQRNRDPWIGFHSHWWTSAAVRNVQISGSPQVPGTVVMSASPSLEGWRSHGRQSVGFEDADWRQTRDVDGRTGIEGRKSAEHVGTHWESLLQYVRPLTRGDAIEYDFFLDESTDAMNPTLGTTALVLRPEGASLHEVTDAEYDQTNLSPDNLTHIGDGAPHRTTIPLQQGAWNHVRIEHQGPSAALWVNQQKVFEYLLADSGPLPFGLFHFADRSAARARNVVMHGGWARELPALRHQSLADLTISQIDERASALSSTFAHSFVRDGLTSPLLRISPAHQLSMKKVPTGLSVVSTSAGPWQAAELTASLELHGDFDIESEFEDLQRSGVGWAGVLMTTEFVDSNRHLARAMFFKDSSSPGPLLQASLSEEKNGERLYDHYDLVECDATSGRLRLSRRGDVVYYLFAEGDSPTFRLVGQRTVSRAPTKMGSLVLQALSHEKSECRVVWRSLTARAEKIVESPTESLFSVEMLNQSRKSLTAVYEYDFAKQGLDTRQFVTRNIDDGGIAQAPTGLRITKSASGPWSYATLLSTKQYSGDFDLEATFEETRLSGQQHACIMLTADLGTDELRSYRLVRMRDDQQIDTVYGQLLKVTRQGTIHDSFEGIASDATRGRLRLARRGKRIAFLFAEEGGSYRIVHEQPCPDEASAAHGFTLECLANESATSSVIWKSVSLRAKTIQ